MTEAQKRVMVRDMGWRCLEPSWEEMKEMRRAMKRRYWPPCSVCHSCKTCRYTMSVQSERCMRCIASAGAPGWAPGVNFCPNCGRPCRQVTEK